MNAKNIYVCSIIYKMNLAEMVEEAEREAEREARGTVSSKGSQAMAEVMKRDAQAKAAKSAKSKSKAKSKAEAAQATVPERVEVEEGVPMHGKMNLQSMQAEIELLKLENAKLKSENAKLKSENEQLKLFRKEADAALEQIIRIQNSPPDTGETTEPELEPELQPENDDTNRVIKPLSNNPFIRRIENAVRGHTSQGEYQFGDVFNAAKSGAKNMFGKGKTRRTYKKRSRKKRRTRRR